MANRERKYPLKKRYVHKEKKFTEDATHRSGVRETKGGGGKDVLFTGSSSCRVTIRSANADVDLDLDAVDVDGDEDLRKGFFRIGADDTEETLGLSFGSTVELDAGSFEDEEEEEEEEIAEEEGDVGARFLFLESLELHAFHAGSKTFIRYCKIEQKKYIYILGVFHRKIRYIYKERKKNSPRSLLSSRI